MDVWVYEVNGVSARFVTCMWVVVDGGRAAVGKAVSGHRTEDAARREADRIGGCYESADIMAMIQSGVDYTTAVQAHANRDRRSARVNIGGAGAVAFYAYRDEAMCRRDAADRVAQGESITVRRYERISGGFVTLHVPHFGRHDCMMGYASLREAHSAGETNVHGYAPVQEQQTDRERRAESARMGWA
jgi:hypothetical protein